MAQILEICSMLGFTDRSSKGLPNALIDEVEQFIVTSSQQGWHTSTEDMTHGYLYDSEAGNRLWGRKSRSGYRPYLEWPRHGDRIEGLLRQLFSVIVQRPPGTESFASPEEERPEQAQTPSIHAGSGDDSGSAAQFANKVHSGHTLKSQKSKRFSEMTNKSTRDDELISSVAPNHSILSSNFEEYGFSQQIPVIARSEAELVEMLRLWMREHNRELPPGATKGSKIVVEVFVAKELMFVGTREMILVDRFLVNETTIGWILRARDGSCMMTKPNNGNNGIWRGYKAWLGGDCGFTDTILVSSDGKRHKPSISNHNTELRDLDMIYRNTGVSNDSLKNTKNAVNPNCHSTTTKTLYVGLSHKGTTDRDGLKASDTRDARAVKSKIEGHRYPTQKRRLASFGNSFEAWEAQGNRGEHTPPTSSFNTIEGYHWPTQRPGTPPIAPQQQSKRRQPPHKLHEAACLQPIGYRSPSIELTSVHQASPRRRGRPRKSKFNGSYPEKKEGRLISATKLPLSPKTPPRASNAITKHTPSSPTSKFLVSPATISEPYQASQIVFHFFLSNEGFGAIPKLFAQCATPKCFFKEAKAAYHALGKSTDKSRLLGVKVTIEGVTRPIVILWESEDGFERMVEAMVNEVVGRIGNLNVEVRGIKMGQAMWEVGVST